MAGIRYFQLEGGHVVDLDKVSIFIPGQKISLGPNAPPSQAQIMIGPMGVNLTDGDAEEIEAILLCRNTKLVTGVEP